MLVPIIVLSLIGIAGYKTFNTKKGVMTNERRAIYDNAMKRNPPLPADQYVALAAAFDNEGLPTYADALRKRADLLNLPPDVKQKRRDAIKKIMSSNDSSTARIAANMFEAEGAFGTAKTLRDYADGVDAAAFASMIAPPPPPPSASVGTQPPSSATPQTSPAITTPDTSNTSTPVSSSVSGGVGPATQASSPEASTPSTPAQSAGVAGTPAPSTGSGDPTGDALAQSGI